MTRSQKQYAESLKSLHYNDIDQKVRDKIVRLHKQEGLETSVLAERFRMKTKTVGAIIRAARQAEQGATP